MTRRLGAARPAGSGRRPWLVAHRGASGHLPEHTLPSYQLAVAMGADVLEPDLVPTRDGVLVDRHEPEISTTTDVADRPEFAYRRRTAVIDGVSMTGWFTEDFTSTELATLRARERIPELRPGNAEHDGRYRVPTFAQVLRLRAQLARRYRRRIGVAPELKHPTYFAGLGLSVESALLTELRRAGLTDRRSGVWVQCFELGSLIRLRRSGYPGTLLFLAAEVGGPADLAAAGRPTEYAELLTRDGLARLARWVDVLGPDKRLVLAQPDDDPEPAPATRLVIDAHRAGLAVVPWTYRAENAYLPARWRRGSQPQQWGDLAGEIGAHLDAGIDGLFTDQPAAARQAVLAWQRRRG